MKQNFDRKWLLGSLKTASSVVNKRSPKEILTKILLRVDDTGAAVIATDTETSICILGADYSGAAASALVPLEAMKFLDSADDDTVLVETKANATAFKCGKSQIKFNTENVMEFPAPSFKQGGDVTKVDGKELQTALRRTHYATDEDSARFALSGVLLNDSASGLVCVGTDGRRLSKCEVAAIAVGGLSNVILPVAAAKTILSMRLEESWLSTSGNNVLLHDDSGVMFCTRTVEGRYPNWKMVFPSLDGYVCAKVNTQSLVRGIKQAAIVTDHETRAIDLTFESGNLTMQSAKTEAGASTVEIPIEFDGDTVATKLDHKFVTDFAEQASEVVEMWIKDDRSPVVVKCGDYEGVLMPMAGDM